MSDVISVTELHLRSSRLEPDLWQRPLKLQPLVVSLQVYTNIDDEAHCDNLLAESLNYGYITKQLELCFDQLEQEDSASGELALEVVAELLAHVVLFKCHAPNVSLQVERPRALLTATAVGLSITRSKSDYHLLTDEPHHHPLDLSRAARNLAADTFYIRQLKRQIIIGLNPGERIDQQEVIVDLEFKHDPIINNDDDVEHERKMPYLLPREMVRPGWRGLRGAVKRVEQHLSTSAPLTIENLVVALSSLLLTPHPGALSPPLGANTQSELAPTWSIPETTVRVSKPSALMFAKYPAVQVTRTRKHFPQLFGAGTAAVSTPAAVPTQQLQHQQQRRDSSSSAILPRATAPPTTTDSAFRAQVTDQAPFSTSTSTRTDGQPPPPQQQQHHQMRIAFIGLGTNLGSRPGNLNDAVTLLDEALCKNAPAAGSGSGAGAGGGGGGRVVETSWMYESEAMYHEEQDKFLNAAIKIETSLEPIPLLAVLKDIEARLGRDFTTFRNGPRAIDLDLLLYDQVVFDSRRREHEQEGAEDAKEKTRWWLKVPHASITEREFVLKPLVDIAPDFVHPVYGKSISALLQDLAGSPSFRSTVHRVFPLSRSRVQPYSRGGPTCSSRGVTATNIASGDHQQAAATTADGDKQTLIMSILNMTPDSFSDGKPERLSDVRIALKEVEAHLKAGADIVDVGGMSTRPGAEDVQSGDEVERGVPVIRAIRARFDERRDGKANGTASATTQEKGPVVISVDTFRPDVARAAIEAGADIINDVYGGREPGMLETMADLACPVVLMHSRGNPSTMTSLTDYSADGGIVQGIRREMEEMVQRAGEAGVRRWNVILDPGFGFAKTGSQNLVLLRSLDHLFRASPNLSEYPVLIGLSRKKFLAPEKKVARERRIETVAGVACAAQSGWCEIARVHDTADARDALAFTDRLLASRES